MGSHDYLSANTHYARTFIFKQTFYGIFQHGKKQILSGKRPSQLTDVETIDQKILKKHSVYLTRLESFPLKKAAYYHQLKESTGVQTVRGLSEITGEDWSYIAKLLRILNLPQGIREFLTKNPFPEIVKHFHLRCLLEIVSIKDEDQQLSRFREIVSELKFEEIS